MPNDKAQMTNEIPNSNQRVYDLEERTARLGELIIDFAKSLERNEINRPLISQIIRSGTSVGANYVEADGAISKKGFRHKFQFVKRKHKKQNIGYG